MTITKTLEDYQEASEGMFGWCLQCGEEFECLEPDGKAICQDCGGIVRGCDDWLVMGLIN